MQFTEHIFFMALLVLHSFDKMTYFDLSGIKSLDLAENQHFIIIFSLIPWKHQSILMEVVSLSPTLNE